MAELRVRVEGASGNVLDVLPSGQLGGVTASGNVASGSATQTDSVSAVTVLTIPAGKTFTGWATVVANSRATTAAYGTAALQINGTNAVPASGSNLLLAGSSRDAAACVVTQQIQATAPAGNSVTLQLVNSTATTFNSSASVNGQFV